MPHVIVKLWPGRSHRQKQRLADRIVQDITDILHLEEESVSVAFEEIASADWAEKVYHPDIVGKPGQLYKKPGYTI
jgi:4-oxalocrotonate tautomerase